MNFPIFVPKGKVKRTLSPLRRHILTVVCHLKKHARKEPGSSLIFPEQAIKKRTKLAAFFW